MTAALQLLEVTVARAGQVLLDAVSLELDRGQAVAIVGPSGAGKTTLIRVALGLQTAQRGQVLLHGQALRKVPGRRRAAIVSWLPQLMLPPESIPVLDMVTAARYRFDQPYLHGRQMADQVLRECGVVHLANRPLNRLSGGELQRVALAALLAQDAEIMLLDEPSNHLDVRRQRELYRLLGAQWRQGRGLLVVTHDINLLSELAAPDRAEQITVVGFEAGRIAFRSHLAEASLGARLSELFQWPFRVLDDEGRRVFVSAARS